MLQSQVDGFLSLSLSVIRDGARRTTSYTVVTGAVCDDVDSTVGGRRRRALRAVHKQERNERRAKEEEKKSGRGGGGLAHTGSLTA